jgi:hypothetical protein
MVLSWTVARRQQIVSRHTLRHQQALNLYVRQTVSRVLGYAEENDVVLPATTSSTTLRPAGTAWIAPRAPKPSHQMNSLA